MLPVYILIFAIIVAAVVAVPVFGGFGKKPKPKYHKLNNTVSLDRGLIQRKWQEVEATANIGGPAQLKASVMDADKLVDQVLASKGLPGDTFADKLKAGKKLFQKYEDYDNLWFAHKVRNSIAHDNGVDFSVTNAKRAMEYFKKALKILGAI
jgi:hypothetical protein